MKKENQLKAFAPYACWGNGINDWKHFSRPDLSDLSDDPYMCTQSEAREIVKYARENFPKRKYPDLHFGIEDDTELLKEMEKETITINN